MPFDTEPLDRAIAELRQMQADDRRMTEAETRVLANWQPTQRTRRPARLFLFVATGLAAAFAGFAILTPSRSAAAEMERIAHNGDEGLRHVVQWEVKPDGSLKKFAEYFASDDRARVVFPEYGQQMVWRPGSLTTYHQDGSATIEHFTPKPNQTLLKWLSFSASQVLDESHGALPAKVSAEHGVVVDGKTVDRYTSDIDFPGRGGQMAHSRLVLLADPQTQKPIREQLSRTGLADAVITWDFPSGSPSLLEGPPVDPARVYDEHQEREQILAGMRSKGPKRTVHGFTVQLKALVVDEHGNAAAITGCDWPYPANYSVRIEGHIVGDVPQTEAEARRYAVEKPCRFEGHPYQVFLELRAPREPDIHLPSKLRVEIPIVEGRRLVGYARFDDVPAIRVWKTWQLLQNDTGYFWEPSKPVGPPQAVVPVQAR